MMLALLKLMRLYYSVPLAGGFIVIVCYLTGCEVRGIVDRLGLSFFCLLSIISGGYVLNDVCDIETDRINCPWRVLAAGKIRKSTALWWSIVLFAAGLAFGWLCGPAFFVGISAVAGFMVFYDRFSKRMGVFKDVLAAILTSSLYPLALTLAEPVGTPRLKVLLIHPVWLFLSALGYEMLKDIRDIKGDRKMRSQGLDCCKAKWFLVMSRVFIVVGSLITVAPFVFGYCRWVYLSASIAAIVLAVLSTFNRPGAAIRYVYAEVFLVTAGSMADLLVYGA